MTPKQQVQRRHPGAYAWRENIWWWIYLRSGLNIGCGPTAAKAWADALRRQQAMKACTHPPEKDSP